MCWAWQRRVWWAVGRDWSLGWGKPQLSPLGSSYLQQGGRELAAVRSCPPAAHLPTCSRVVTFVGWWGGGVGGIHPLSLAVEPQVHPTSASPLCLVSLLVSPVQTALLCAVRLPRSGDFGPMNAVVVCPSLSLPQHSRSRRFYFSAGAAADFFLSSNSNPNPLATARVVCLLRNPCPLACPRSLALGDRQDERAWVRGPFQSRNGPGLRRRGGSCHRRHIALCHHMRGIAGRRQRPRRRRRRRQRPRRRRRRRRQRP
jgi:hypothetical protein